jgi:hypothetical protein
MKKVFIGLFIISAIIPGCKEKEQLPKADPASVKYVHEMSKSLNDIIIYDIFSAPVASRIYAYSTIAAYESSRFMDTSYRSLTTQLNGFEALPAPDKNKLYDFRIASVSAFYTVVQKLTFTGDSTMKDQKIIMDSLQVGIPKSILDRSIQFGKSIATVILDRAAKDNYKMIQGMERYTVKVDDPSKWKTTAPDYLDAVQPFWTKMKPLVMDSSAQFAPPRPPAYSLDKSSAFYKDLNEVYLVRKNLTPLQKEIAYFWDDNASASTHVGHLKYTTKKPSPGGHWINITSQASQQIKQGWVAAAQTYAMTSIAMFDGFISCWDEKYRSEYLRPITAINESIDQQWEPLLQTPPFPEYTSGHSVISSSIAGVLTKIFGEQFAFTDSYEKPYIQIVRSFSSFREASEEACMSRLYGGIHFRTAIKEGEKQGSSLGDFINSRIQLK